MTFEFATAQRVVFGRGTAARIPAELARLCNRPFLVSGRDPARYGVALEGDMPAVRVTGEPDFEQVRRAVDAARQAGCDGVLAIGGGSVIDTGKAVAMLLANGGDPMEYAEVIGAGRPIQTPSFPLIAVPTTAGAGSEVTRNAVLRDPVTGVKVSLRAPGMLPTIAWVDPELSRPLPPDLTAATGLDALTQLIEPFLSIRANPLTDALCREGLPRIFRSLTRAVRNGSDLEARSDMALAATLGGMALANAGLGAIHGFAAALGGRYAIPHGVLCAVLLAPVLEANIRHQPDASFQSRVAEIARMATGRSDAGGRDLIDHVRCWVTDLGIRPLSAWGVAAADAESLCEAAAAASSMKGNPVVLPRSALREILAASM